MDQDDSDKDWENAAEGGSKDATVNDQSGREVPYDADYGSKQADRQEEDPTDEQKVHSQLLPQVADSAPRGFPLIVCPSRARRKGERASGPGAVRTSRKE